MNFSTNFSKLALMANETIKIYFTDKTVEFVPPNLRLYLLDLDFFEFSILFTQNSESFNKDFLNENFVTENKYEAFLAILYSNYKNEEILYYLNKIFPNLEYKNKQIKCNDVPLSNEEYDVLIDFLEVSYATLDFKTFMKKMDLDYQGSKELTDAQKKMKEAEERIAKAKKKNKKNKDNKPSPTITIDQIIIAVLYEFPGLGIEDIYNMNLFTLLEFWTYVSKVVDNQILIVAAGNGLSKEFTYFIN